MWTGGGGLLAKGCGCEIARGYFPGLETRGWNGTKSAFADYASASTHFAESSTPKRS